MMKKKWKKLGPDLLKSGHKRVSKKVTLKTYDSETDLNLNFAQS